MFNPVIRHFNRGVAHGEAGRYEEAIEAFYEALRIKPHFAEAWYNIGISHRKLGDKQAAIEAFKEAIRIDPEYAQSYCDLSVVYNDIGRKQEAIEALTEGIKAVSDKDELTWMYFGLGTLYGAYRQWNDAVEAYTKSATIDSDLSREYGPIIKEFLASAYFELGLWQKVVEVLQEVFETNPDKCKGSFLYQLSKAYDQLALYDKALEVCHQGIQNDSQNRWAYLALGSVYGRQGDDQKEIEAYKEAIRTSPDFAAAHHALGLSYTRIGHYQEAIEAFKYCIRINPDHIEAHLDLGIAYDAIEDKNAALQEYKILKTLDVEQANKLFNRIYK